MFKQQSNGKKGFISKESYILETIMYRNQNGIIKCQAEIDYKQNKETLF